MKKFPKELFVKIETDTNDDTSSWFLADDNIQEHASIGVTTKVAVYKLVEVRAVTGTVTYKTRKVVE